MPATIRTKRGAVAAAALTALLSLSACDDPDKSKGADAGQVQRLESKVSSLEGRLAQLEGAIGALQTQLAALGKQPQAASNPLLDRWKATNVILEFRQNSMLVDNTTVAVSYDVLPDRVIVICPSAPDPLWCQPYDRKPDGSVFFHDRAGNLRPLLPAR